MKSLQDALPPASRAKLVTLTTDPDYDTPPVMKKYGERFGADFNRWKFLTGTKAEIAALAGGSLKFSAVPVKPEDQKNPADLFIHTTIFVVVDKHARLRGIFETGGDGMEWTNVQPRIIAHRAPTRTRAMTVHDLPAVNASLNGLSAIFLTAGYIFIRRKNKNRAPQLHGGGVRHLNLFLTCYLTYHGYLAIGFAHGPTRFLEPEWFRPIYLAILRTHTVLAVVIVPMILMTLNRARLQRFELHKKIARWTWPLWMYVSVTGVVVYWLLYIKFPQK